MDNDADGVERRHRRYGRRRSDRHWIAILVFVCVVSVAFSIGTAFIVRTEHAHTEQIRKLNATLTIAVLTQCNRVNNLRGQVNNNEQRIHDGLQILSTQMEQFIIDSHSSPGLRAILLTELSGLARISSALTTTPATDCMQAIAHPRTYMSPQATPIPTYIPRRGDPKP